MAGGGKLLGVSWAGSSLCGSTLPTLDCQGRGQQGGKQRQESHAQPPRTPHSTRLVPTNGVSGGQECPPMYQHLSQHSLGSPLVFLLQMSPSSREKLSFRFCPGKMWARQHHASLLHFPSHDDDWHGWKWSPIISSAASAPGWQGASWPKCVRARSLEESFISRCRRDLSPTEQRSNTDSSRILPSLVDYFVSLKAQTKLPQNLE